MSAPLPATTSTTSNRSARSSRALFWALAVVLLLALPRARTQWLEHDASAARGRPFWMQANFPALLQELAEHSAAKRELVLFCDRKGLAYQRRLFGLQFHAVPQAVRDVTKFADARAALNAGQAVLIDFENTEQSENTAAKLCEASGATSVRHLSGTALLVLPAEPNE